MNDLARLVANNKACIRRSVEVTPLMAEWFDRELLALPASQRRGGVILMGAPVWGPRYIQRMALYSLASMGSDRNIAALSGRCEMLFYTTRAERPLVWDATRWLRQCGVHTIMAELPEALVALASQTPEDRYALLATVQNILAHRAGRLGMGLHMWMVDHLYGEGYFERLGVLGTKHEAIVQQGVSVDVASAAGDLERWREPTGAIAIPDRELGGVALAHMHERSSRNVIGRDGRRVPDRMPDCRQVMWVGRDALCIADPCQNLAWLAPELCLDAPVNFMSTLDMLAPDYVRGPWYMPAADDGLAFCELSDADREPSEPHASLPRFLLRAWAQVGFTDDYWEYFERLCRVPIPPQADGLSDAEIDLQHRQVLELLRAGKTRSMEAYHRGQFPPRFDRRPQPAQDAQALAAD